MKSCGKKMTRKLKNKKADDGNRTRLSSLGSWRSTDELHPQGVPFGHEPLVEHAIPAICGRLSGSAKSICAICGSSPRARAVRGYEIEGMGASSRRKVPHIAEITFSAVSYLPHIAILGVVSTASMRPQQHQYRKRLKVGNQRRGRLWGRQRDPLLRMGRCE